MDGRPLPVGLPPKPQVRSVTVDWAELGVSTSGCFGSDKHFPSHVAIDVHPGR